MTDDRANPSLFRHVPPWRFFWRPIKGFVLMVGSVVAYMSVGVGLGMAFGPFAMIAWVVGTMVSGTVYLCALNDWERERDE